MPTIVFLHAFPLNHEMWQAQVSAMPPGWTALAPDCRGFGNAPADATGKAARSTASLDEFVDDVVAALDGRGLERAVFCGCSMGGYTALTLLRRYPHRVAGLVLADTRASADAEAARASRKAMLDLLDREGPAAVTASMLPRLVGATTRQTRPDVMRAVAAMASQATSDGIGYAVTRMLNRPDNSPVLAAFDGPVLVVVGSEDELTPVADAEVMAALVPGSRLVVIPQAGHLSNLEAPELFNSALGSFLSEQFDRAPEPESHLSAEAWRRRTPQAP